MSDFFGGGGSPEVAYEPTEVVQEQTKASSQRTKLLKTAGGIVGQELSADQTKKRESIFGNV